MHYLHIQTFFELLWVYDHENIHNQNNKKVMIRVKDTLNHHNKNELFLQLHHYKWEEALKSPKT